MMEMEWKNAQDCWRYSRQQSCLDSVLELDCRLRRAVVQKLRKTLSYGNYSAYAFFLWFRCI
jgi:hypothetical protein